MTQISATTAEQLQACYLSGQMSEAQRAAHVEAGEMPAPTAPAPAAGFARFDGAAAWRQLGTEDKAKIGALVLEMFCAWYASERAEERRLSEPVTPLERAALASTNLLLPRLQCAIVDALPRHMLLCDDGTPRLPSLMGPVCRVCGCSHRNGCHPYCSWVEPDLCSACKTQEA